MLHTRQEYNVYIRNAPRPKWYLRWNWPPCFTRLCNLVTDSIENTWRNARHLTIRRLTDHRRRTMCKRAQKHDIARIPSKMQNITDQNGLESYLLKLPLELRLQIYRYIYPQSTILTIWDKFMRNRYRLYPQDMTHWFYTRSYSTPCAAHVPYRKDTSLALPLTCRAIYTETIPYIYGRYQFRFSDLRLILSLPDVIPVKHLQFVTSLSLLFNVDSLIDLFDLSEIRFVTDQKFVNDPNLAVARRRKKYVRLWPFLSSTLINIHSLIINFRRVEMTDVHREQQFCDWLMTPLLQSQNGKSVWSEKLVHFEIRLGGRWESLVSRYTKPLTINGGSHVAPFELKSDCNCNFGGWGCQCSKICRDT